MILDLTEVYQLNKQQQQQITGGIRTHTPCGDPSENYNTSSGYCEPV
ncbi:hypothetical protein [Aquimarina sp. 2201CG14-23]|nr:hypothetical protein [Aquimarina sp. 2201CG14-23]MDH7444038.1 hypothetical protein [Aquimarina sp. 2201CG14-23]